jgi:DASS family divalent anion:Na+ symporter
MNATASRWIPALKALAPFALGIGIWLTPIPEGLTREAWHLFALFAGAIFAVIVNAYPLLTSALLAGSIAVLSNTLDPAKAFAGFANPSVLLVVVAFLVAQAVVKCGLGQRISLKVVSLFGKSTLGLAYSIFITDALIAPGFPSNTARGGVLYPIILALSQSSGSVPEDEAKRRLGGYLMFCGMASLAISSALWLTATSANPIGVSLAAEQGLKVRFRLKWLLVASVPALVTIGPAAAPALPPFSARGDRHARGAARRRASSCARWARCRATNGSLPSTFAVMVGAWIFAGVLNLSLTAVAIAGLGTLLALRVLTLEDIYLQGSTLATFLWLAVLFALSGQLNEMGFMSYVGQRLASMLGGISWPVAYVALLGLYVLMHYMFVSQSAQVLALLGVFLDVGIQAGVPVPLMGFALLFASSYFSTLTPQGGSQNVIFAASGYLTQRELYRLGLITTVFCTVVFLVIGTPWILWVG